mgnify:CR=1 FL=1
MEKRKASSYPVPKVIESLPVSELEALYKTLLQAKPPASCSPDFLKGNILWALQAIEAGHCPIKLRYSLLKLANIGRKKPSRSIKSGTRLIREWHGKTHEVTVLDHGYLWNDNTYASLTQIAREITGTHQSGPKFFGLSQKHR